MASICFSERLFDDKVLRFNRQVMLDWCLRFRTKLDAIATQYPPRDELDMDALADMISVVADGGIVLSKVLGTARIAVPR